MLQLQYLKSTKIAVNDVYRKLSQVMKHGYIILNLKGKLISCDWLKKPCYSKTMPKHKESIIRNFRSQWCLCCSSWQSKRTINYRIYYVLKKIRKKYKRKSPKSWIRNIWLLHDNAPNCELIFGKRKRSCFAFSPLLIWPVS